MRFSSSLLGWTAFFTTAVSISAKIIEVDWDISWVDASPDGFTRKVTGVNGQWPLPHLRASKGDTVRINMHNSLGDADMTLHGHGLFQNGTADQDGASMITECATPPGGRRTYEYHLCDQVGTYWVHSHQLGQYMDGLRTPFIIDDPDVPFKYDDEVVVTVADWYHNVSSENIRWFLSRENTEATEPVPQSGLINDSKDTIFKFKPNKTYRLRLINMSGFATFFFSLDGHEFEVIEVDGAYTEPYRTKNLYVSPSQRMSLLVRTKDNTEKNFLMHADMDTSVFDYMPAELNPNITAPVYYNDDTSESSFAPSDDIGAGSNFEDFRLRSLEDIDAVEPDISYNFTVEQQTTTDGINRGMINRVPMIFSRTPTYMTMATMGNLSSSPLVYGPQGRGYITKHLDMVELIVNNYDTDAHPFHLHGHRFQIVARSAKSQFLGDRSTVDWVTHKPVIRDTVRVPANGYVILRYRADNPGAWLFHCHIDWHFLAGMGVVMVEAPEKVAGHPVNPVDAEHCRQLGLHASGNAAGKEGLDLTGAPAGVYLPQSSPLATPDDDDD
ncbi:Cupredoxin [Syncephalastrum racemosum]|uniref:Cupredoxin n=1 Tax=Syncephalastrum racemosum TaxID=13706 RepID=A0A1X2H1V9_SYNRA|nr:Cupredoxin [Syncephalastrum racemosum]